MTPKNLTKEEWEKQIDFIFNDYKEKNLKCYLVVKGYVH